MAGERQPRNAREIIEHVLSVAQNTICEASMPSGSAAVDAIGGHQAGSRSLSENEHSAW